MYLSDGRLAHPIEDAIEVFPFYLYTGIRRSSSFTTAVRELEYPMPPRQIEFAKLYLTNVVTGKRYIKKLVDQEVLLMVGMILVL